MLQEMYDQLNEFLISIPKKVEISKIFEREKELGVIMPECMKDFYEYYGNNMEILNAYYNFNNIDEVCIENSALVFGYTHQKKNKIGITLEKLNSKYQSISWYSKDLKQWFSEGAVFPESFFFNIAGWQILNSLPAMVRVELTNSKFEVLQNKSFKFFNNDKRFVKGYKIITLKCNDVLGCYLREDEELYLGAMKDETIENLEYELNLDFDWL